MSEITSIIQREKDELIEMKKVRSETGLSLGKLIELKKKGYKIVKIDDKIKEKCKCR